MGNVSIITDSSAYLPQSYIDELPISVIPLSLVWEGKTYRDGLDISATAFYRMLAKSDHLPTTSQTTVGEYEAIFSKLTAEGRELLVLPISSGISGSLNSALQAKTSFPNAPIEIVDTRLVSMALSFQVLTAARAAKEGASLKECKELAQEAYHHIGVFFTVDTLKYLEKGGRIGSAKRLLGTALSIKPIMEIRAGKIELVKSVISRHKAIEAMLDMTEHGIAGRTPVHISVFHADVEEEALKMQATAEKRFGATEAILSEVSPAIGSHTGPGTLSIAYMAGM